VIESHHLEAAREVIARTLAPTPIREAPALGEGVWIKLETEQPTGSFKVRGAVARLAALDEATRACGVVAASAGNHGMGLAWASRALGVPCTVHVPRGVARVKRDGIVALGATVVVGEHEGYDETEDEARAAAGRTGATYVSPYDDPHVASGNGGTLGLEILAALPNCATIVAPVGGGGLIVGLGAARRAASAEGRLRIVGVQSEASPAMALSLERGEAIERYRGAPTLAEGLEGGVSARIFAAARQVLDRVELVREDEIAAAMAFARDMLGVTIEGSAAVALAWMLRRPAVPRPTVVVLTGRNVD
jgi:threonine dehydratase